MTSLAFVQDYPLEDIAAWSQTPANMRANFHAILGGAFREEGGFRYPLQPVLRARALVFRKLLGRPFLSDRSPGRWRYFSKAAQTRLAGYQGWTLSPGTAFLAFWSKTPGLRRAFWTDATFRQFIDYWPSHQSSSRRFRDMGDELERRALHNADLCIYSSRWAADSAVKDYEVDPQKVLIAPFGPNLPASMLEVADRVWSLPKAELRVLSIGVDWSRKGMDAAVRLVSALREKGLKIFLDIAGVSPPEGERVPDFVQLHGRLSKTDPEQQAKLVSLFEAASAFILLSRADASPIVFCEAAAFGLPRIGIDTGGVRDLIGDGVDGSLFSPEMEPAEMAAALLPVFGDPERLMKMRQSARHGYETRWNWPTQCKRVLERMSAAHNR